MVDVLGGIAWGGGSFRRGRLSAARLVGFPAEEICFNKGTLTTTRQGQINTSLAMAMSGWRTIPLLQEQRPPNTSHLHFPRGGVESTEKEEHL